MSYKDWDVVNRWGAQEQGINMWATTDTPEAGLPVFGYTCNDPTQTWDDEYGQWWLSDCRFGNPTGPQFFQPPRRRLVPAQQNFHNIYQMSPGGPLGLMGDGSVRSFPSSISIPAWSAAVTPNGGEAMGSRNGSPAGSNRGAGRGGRPSPPPHVFHPCHLGGHMARSTPAGRWAAGAFAALALATASCGKFTREERLPDSGATLEGTVQFGGEPVQFAMILVQTQNGSATGRIGDDGRYRVENVPLGDVKVGVNTAAAQGEFQSKMMSARGLQGAGGQGAGASERAQVHPGPGQVPQPRHVRAHDRPSTRARTLRHPHPEVSRGRAGRLPPARPARYLPGARRRPGRPMPDDPTGSVTQFFHRLRAGDPAAAAGLWQHFFPRLVGLARHALAGRPQRAADAEDAALAPSPPSGGGPTTSPPSSTATTCGSCSAPSPSARPPARPAARPPASGAAAGSSAKPL